jgi:transposase
MPGSLKLSAIVEGRPPDKRSDDKRLRRATATFSWFARNRRLAKDYENLADTPAAFVTLAAIQLGIRRSVRA